MVQGIVATMQINTRQAPPPLPPGPSPTAGDSNVGMIFSVSGLMMGLSFAIVGLRIWVRQFMINTLGVDDMVMMAALVSKHSILHGTLRPPPI